MERILLAAAIALAAAVVAHFMKRRTPAAAPTQTGTVPVQLDRSHFVAPDAPWLIAVFSSATCMACAEVTRMARAYERDGVAFQDVEHIAERDLHKRYGIDSVPTTVVADDTGIVHGAWIGPLSVDDRAELEALLS